MPHVLYTDKDFTVEEVQRGNHLAKMVVEWGLSVCKICGAAECELENPCRAILRVASDMGEDKYK